MRLRYPFAWLSPTGRKRALAGLVPFTAVVIAGLAASGAPLARAGAGILAFEFAGDLSAAQCIVERWEQNGLLAHAGLNLGLDYVFLVAYAGAIGLGCELVGRRLSGRAGIAGTLGAALAWAQSAAALLDGVENYALIRVLLGSGRPLWPVVARWCAIPKFAIVGAGLLYAIVGAVVIAAPKRGGKEPAAGL